MSNFKNTSAIGEGFRCFVPAALFGGAVIVPFAALYLLGVVIFRR